MRVYNVSARHIDRGGAIFQFASRNKDIPDHESFLHLQEFLTPALLRYSSEASREKGSLCRETFTQPACTPTMQII